MAKKFLDIKEFVKQLNYSKDSYDYLYDREFSDYKVRAFGNHRISVDEKVFTIIADYKEIIYSFNYEFLDYNDLNSKPELIKLKKKDGTEVKIDTLNWLILANLNACLLLDAFFWALNEYEFGTLNIPSERNKKDCFKKTISDLYSDENEEYDYFFYSQKNFLVDYKLDERKIPRYAKNELIRCELEYIEKLIAKAKGSKDLRIFYIMYTFNRFSHFIDVICDTYNELEPLNRFPYFFSYLYPAIECSGNPYYSEQNIIENIVNSWKNKIYGFLQSEKHRSVQFIRYIFGELKNVDYIKFFFFMNPLINLNDIWSKVIESFGKSLTIKHRGYYNAVRKYKEKYSYEENYEIYEAIYRFDLYISYEFKEFPYELNPFRSFCF